MKKRILLEAIIYTMRQKSFLLDVDQGARGWGKRNKQFKHDLFSRP